MKKRLIIIFILTSLIISLGFSYAYFKARIVGEGTPISAKAKELKLIYTDNMSLSGTNIEPGWSDSKTFSVKNESSEVYNYNIVFKELVNTFVTEGFLQYKITSTNGYNMTEYKDIPKSQTKSTQILAENIEIPVGVTQEYKIEFIYRNTEEDQSEDMGQTLRGTLAIELYTAPTLANTIKAAYPPQPGRTDFANIDNSTPGLYTGIDDQGTTYYFSGDGSTMNNWVSFAGKKWRIIRINGNGSVRLLYAGDGNDATSIGSSSYSTNVNMKNHPAYVGWKYTEGDSLEINRENGIKSGAYAKVEEWYNELSSTNKSYIDTKVIYCNDRNIGNGYSYDTNVEFNYATYDRLTANKTPSFNCSNSSDRFYNFGLMTADEIVYAGGKFATNSPKAYYYLAQDGISSIIGNHWWWTMSPYGLLNNGYAYVYGVDGSNKPGFYSGHAVHSEGIIRPVISLKSNVLVTEGDGSGASPYEISI
ncbi:MAG: hypothetical protein HFE04_03565 [Bacilli bacterium]|nr:hypothetical protein [Bacilli bacterium]